MIASMKVDVFEDGRCRYGRMTHGAEAQRGSVVVDVEKRGSVHWNGEFNTIFRQYDIPCVLALQYLAFDVHVVIDLFAIFLFRSPLRRQALHRWWSLRWLAAYIKLIMNWAADYKARLSCERLRSIVIKAYALRIEVESFSKEDGRARDYVKWCWSGVSRSLSLSPHLMRTSCLEAS